MRKTKQNVNPEKTSRRRTQPKKPCHTKKCVWNTRKRHVYMNSTTMAWVCSMFKVEHLSKEKMNRWPGRPAVLFSRMQEKVTAVVLLTLLDG